MMTVKPLDELLGHEILLHSGNDEEFNDALGETWDKRLKTLYWSRDGLKFVLFEHEGNGYLRLQDEEEAHHYHIRDRFYGELTALGIDQKSFTTCGGGDVKAKRQDRKTNLLYSGASDVLGKFNEDLLRQVLENHLDKRVVYEIN